MARVRHAARQKPTPEQLRVMDLEKGPARVLAGAGSGKTATMTRLVERHVFEHRKQWGRGTAPERILALTFTVKAAEEMRKRLLGALGNEALKLTVANFHSYALEVVRENAAFLGVEAEAPVLRRGRAWLMVLEELSAEDLSLRALDLSDPATAADRVLTLLSAAKNDLVELGTLRERTEDDLLNPLATEEMKICFQERLDILDLAERFEARRERRGLLRYEDMISLAARVLSNPEKGAPYRDRYDLVVVDEFQDTNPAQLRLVELLAEEDISRVIVIGDDLQSIYNFTGASIRNIQTFEDLAGVPSGSHTFPLSVNFRSGERILDLANHIAREVHPATSPDEPKILTPRDDAPEGEVRVFNEPSDTDEGREVAARISKLVEGGTSPGSCAVLIRRWDQAAAILDALSEAGIPCEVAESGDLLARPEVTLLSDYLRLVASPTKSGEALLRILSRGPFLLSPADLELVFGAKEGPHAALADPDSVDDLSAEASERLHALRCILDELEGEFAAADSLGTFVERAIEVTGLGGELRSTPTPAARLALQFLDLFRDVAREFGDVQYIEELIRYLEIMDDSTSPERVAPPTEFTDAVRVMTVHRAKGLEFDHVFVPGLSHELFPNSRSRIESPLEKAHALPPPLELNPDPDARDAYDMMDAAALKDAMKREAQEEEGRLFYVATTRARQSLTLSRAHFYRRNKNPKKPGRFWEMLQDAPPEVALALPPEPEVPESNPNIEADSEREPAPVDPWPLEAASTGDDAEIAAGLGVEGWEDELRELRRDVQAIPRLPRAEHLLPPPETHSPSSLMTFETCPRRYYHEHIFTVPSLVGDLEDAQDYGSEIHAWIEGGMAGEYPKPRGGWKPSDEPPGVDLRDTYYGRRAARYPLFEGDQPPPSGPARMVEVPFTLPLDGTEIRGRIDAVFVDEDGTFHLVDWKSGRPRQSYAERLQLPLYALAANRLWGVEPEKMHLVYVFTHDGSIVAVDNGTGFLKRAEKRVLDAVARIRGGSFEPIPSKYGCSHCPVMGVGITGCPTEVPER
jgi:DNA helicase-2/ATP-dependent DNA helicase PcrA